MANCNLMKFVAPDATTLSREATVTGNRIIPQADLDTFNNAYLNSVAGITQAQTNLKNALVVQANALTSGDMTAYNDATLVVKGIQTVLAQYQQTQKNIFANSPPDGAFVAHSTYCLLTSQQTTVGKKLI